MLAPRVFAKLGKTVPAAHALEGNLTGVHGFSAVARGSLTCDKPSSKNSQLISSFIAPNLSGSFILWLSVLIRGLSLHRVTSSLNWPFLQGELNIAVNIEALIIWDIDLWSVGNFKSLIRIVISWLDLKFIFKAVQQIYEREGAINIESLIIDHWSWAASNGLSSPDCFDDGLTSIELRFDSNATWKVECLFQPTVAHRFNTHGTSDGNQPNIVKVQFEPKFVCTLNQSQL